jgi:N-methylhydantoinase B
MTVDPVTFEILSHRLHQITLEMGTTLERVGGTVNTTQMHDYMAALYLPNGDVLSAGESMARHAACAGFAVKRIKERFEQEGGIYPDDVFLINDPYLAAIHQSDIYMVSPIHFKEQLLGWSATFVHVMDIGAMSPGGNSPAATEICQEGLRIPGLKLVERGKLRQDVFDTLINMTRQPVMVGLDLKCEIAANNVAKSRMQEMLEQYGAELITSVSADMIHHSESILKMRIREIPDGVWTDFGAIEADEKWKVILTLTKKADRLIFDFSGSDKQARRGINLPYHATYGACFEAVLSTLGYDLPRNHGAFGSIDVIAPAGTVVHVQYPGPVSLNTTSGMKTVQYLSGSVLMQMLATSEKWKREVMALSLGFRLARHAGVNQHGRYYVSTLLDLSGAGATSCRDGIHSGGYLTAHNAEWIEANFPLLYLFRRHVKDGGGAGTFVGGAGAEAALALHDAPEGKIKIIAFGVAGLRNSGQGIFGGYPAAPSLLMLLENTKLPDLIADRKYPGDLAELGGQLRLLPYSEIEFTRDDVLYIRAASGGGYGDPLEREPQLVSEDVRNNLVSKETAEQIYGLVMDESALSADPIRTQQLRLKLRQQRTGR